MTDSIREALTTAYNEAEKTPASPAPAEQAAAPESEIVETEPKEAEVSASDKSKSEAAPGEEAPSGKDPQAPEAAAAAAPEQSAPVSWSNEERAAWATVPAKAREAIMRREGEMNRALRTSAQARQRTEALDKVVEPYKPLLDRYGVTVEQILPPLLATRAALEVGTAEQKATLVANLCGDFGIDLELLDTALAGRYQNGKAAPRQVAPQIPDLSQNPQLAPVFALVEQFKAAQAERAQQAIQAVASDPHYEEVRFTMADLIEMAQRRGKTMDLPTALELAKRAHGLAVPPPAPSVSEAARTLAAARNAAVSVSGAPKPSPPRKPGEGTLREEIEANMKAAKL